MSLPLLTKRWRKPPKDLPYRYPLCSANWRWSHESLDLRVSFYADRGDAWLISAETPAARAALRKHGWDPETHFPSRREAVMTFYGVLLAEGLIE